MKNIILYKYYNYFLAKNLTRLRSTLFIGALIFITCNDVNDLLITEQTSKTSNGRFELSLTIDPDIVYDNSSTKLIAKITRIVPRDSLVSVTFSKDTVITIVSGDTTTTIRNDTTTVSTDALMYCLINSVGGDLDIHSLIYDDKVNEKKYFQVTIDAAKGSTWEGLAFYNPITPLKDRGHISAIFDGMNLTLPVKLVTNPSSGN